MCVFNSVNICNFGILILFGIYTKLHVFFKSSCLRIKGFLAVHNQCVIIFLQNMEVGMNERVE